MTTQDLDDKLAHAICTRFEHAGRYFQEGTFVAIEGGRVLGVGTTFEEADEILQQAGVADGEGVVCEVTPPSPVIIR